MAACYMCYSLPYWLRTILPFNKLACSRLETGQKFLIQSSGHDNTLCTIVFFFTYYFEISGSLWWLILTFTWYLSAVRKWVEEEIEKRSSYLHMFSWGLSSLLVIAILITRKIDASELTGICSVGNSDPWALLWFIMGPKAVILFVGICFIISGFRSVCQERDSFRRRGTDTSKLNKFMLKMGSFCTLYVCPATISALCNFYNFLQLLEWYQATIGCKLNGGAYNGMCIRPELPKAEYYVLNVTMSLTVGIATGLWIFSPKTWVSWRNFLCCGGNFLCCGGNFDKTNSKQKVFYGRMSEYGPSNFGAHNYPVNAYQQQQQFILARPLIPQKQQQQSNSINLTVNANGAIHNGHLVSQNVPPPSSNSEFESGHYYSGRVTYYGNSDSIGQNNGGVLQQPPRYILATTNVATTNMNLI